MVRICLICKELFFVLERTIATNHKFIAVALTELP
jgi:hypothetical protein